MRRLALSKTSRRRPWGLLLAGSAALVSIYGFAALWSGGPIFVIDGDTVRRKGITHRLVGYDAPELQRARCPQERSRGKYAVERLEALIATAKEVRLTAGRPDRYGRLLSRLELDGVDVRDIAIRENWGEPYYGRGPRPDWCTRLPRPLD